MADKDGGKDVGNEENTIAKDIVVTKYKAFTSSKLFKAHNL